MVKKGVLAACAAVGLALGAAAGERENIVVVAAHPDDLGCCLGFVLKAKEKFDIHLVDFTAGEASRITPEARIAEEEAVCKEAGIALHWLGERDGDSYASREACAKLTELFKELKPRAVIAHWPVSNHTDHQMSSVVATRAMKKAGIRPEFYYMNDFGESRNFSATHFVDISDVAEEKWRLCRLYTSQNRNGWLVKGFMDENRFWGATSFPGVRFAEAFARFGGELQGTKSVMSELKPSETRGTIY